MAVAYLTLTTDASGDASGTTEAIHGTINSIDVVNGDSASTTVTVELVGGSGKAILASGALSASTTTSMPVVHQAVDAEGATATGSFVPVVVNNRLTVTVESGGNAQEIKVFITYI